MRVSTTQMDLIEEYYRARARESFDEYRRQIRPQMLSGWWTRDVAKRFDHFYQRFRAGERPKLELLAPPQHGKSLFGTDFISYVAGRAPSKKTIFASVSDEISLRTNLELQRIMTSPTYQKIFPHTVVGTNGWLRNASVVEFANQPGSFRSTTIGGQVNGHELHLGVIDDPVKGRKEASSKHTRDATWVWFTDDFWNRFAKDGALLLIMTRWHVDDLAGRLIDRFPDLQVIRYPALAEHDEPHRRAGEPLFPEFKPLDFLLERKQVLAQSSWQSLFQQSPIVVGGGPFPIDKLRVVPVFDRNKVRSSIRAWDKGATHGGGDFTVGLLMHLMVDKTYIIADIARGQWSALERDQMMKATADSDVQMIPGDYEIWLEQEPGSGGKESFEASVRNLAGHQVYGEKVTGSKELRAEPFAAQVQAGNVSLIAGPHVEPFLDELEAFPHGSHDDQVDAASLAFCKLVRSTSYNLDAMQ